MLRARKKNALSSALIMIALKVHFTHLHDRMQPNMGTSVQIPRSNLPSAVKNDQPSKSFLSAAIRSYLKIWCLSQNYFFIFEILANWPNSKLKKMAVIVVVSSRRSESDFDWCLTDLKEIGILFQGFKKYNLLSRLAK